MDPTVKSLLDIGATVTKPQRTHKVGGKSVDWTPAQYDRLQELTGGAGQAGVRRAGRKPGVAQDG